MKPSDRSDPLPPPPPPPPTGASTGVDTGTSSPAEAALAALLEWRERATTGIAGGVTALSETKLRMILQSGHTTAEELAKFLPTSLHEWAADLAAFLASFRQGVDTAAPVPAATAPSPEQVEGAGSAITGDAPPPPPAPGAGGAPPSPTTGSHAGLGPQDFDEYDLGNHSSEAPLAMAASPAASGGWNLTWPRHAGMDATVVYRLVARDDHAPYAPESGDLVAVTDAVRAPDERAFTSAVRHYQVWRNGGPDLDSALHSQPVLHADVAVVGRVESFELREDSGRVVGQWTVPRGVERVQVHRVPVERARDAGPSEEFRILAHEDNLGGFVDTGVTRGATYLYLVYAQARVEGVTRLSNAARRQEVTVSAVLAPVEDLAVTAHGAESDRMFDVQWSDPPAGRVLIFRTQQPPIAGATNEARPVSALLQMRLADADRLHDPIYTGAHGQSGMRAVPWPEGWTRAYFTPVTVLNETAQVGRTTSATWVPPVGLPRIVERVGRQVLTFAWPTGAASVLVHVGPRGATPQVAMASPPYEISESRYRELGGLTFPVHLPPLGCSLHIVPVAFAAGERVEGTAVTVEYPGLLRLAYRSDLKRNITGRPTAVTVAITSELELDGPPPFALVYNSERLPLDVSDGTVLEVVLDGDETIATTRRPVPQRLSAAEPSRWTAEVKHLRGGYVRLFVDIPPAILSRVALIDPPVTGLSLESRPGWR